MKHLIILAILALGLSSCTKNLVPFTNEMKEQNNWGDKEMKRIQFYTSGELKIQRYLKSGESAIQNGKVTMIDGKEVEEVVIKKGTPGVAVLFPNSNNIAISFEVSDDHNLNFGVNPKRGTRFYLLAKEWHKKIGKVTYNGRMFTASPESADVFLMVDLKKINKWNIDQRVAKGRTVDG